MVRAIKTTVSLGVLDHLQNCKIKRKRKCQPQNQHKPKKKKMERVKHTNYEPEMNFQYPAFVTPTTSSLTDNNEDEMLSLCEIKIEADDLVEFESANIGVTEPSNEQHLRSRQTAVKEPLGLTNNKISKNDNNEDDEMLSLFEIKIEPDEAVQIEMERPDAVEPLNDQLGLGSKETSVKESLKKISKLKDQLDASLRDEMF